MFLFVLYLNVVDILEDFYEPVLRDGERTIYFDAALVLNGLFSSVLKSF